MISRFTYGTLQRKGSNHRVLEDLGATFVSECWTAQRYPMFQINFPFPFLQNNKGEGKIIKGELWQIDDDKTDRLDFFEGTPNLYYRGKIEIKVNKVIHEVHTYFKTQEVILGNVNLLDKWI